jgi:hypothetical protein
MEWAILRPVNEAFFFVTDKIIDLQSFFMTEAWAIGRIILVISLSLAAIGYGITGEGLKSNLIKIAKAVLFFVIVMAAYPRILDAITRWTFEKAMASVYSDSVERVVEDTKESIALAAEEGGENIRNTYAQEILTSEVVSEDSDPRRFFSALIQERSRGERTYTAVAPAAALQSVLLVAGECFLYAGKNSFLASAIFGGGPVALIIASVCGFLVLFAGVFCILEYLIAYMEFMLVTSVGIIMFPLSLWEGSKFMAEKLIGAIVGFFLKLLFCNICIFLVIYGFMSLANSYTLEPFTGAIEQVVILVFVGLLFVFLSKSAAGLAQSLLTGTPSLSAAGAIGAAAGAIAAGTALASGAGGAAKLAGGVAGRVAGRVAFGGAGAISQAAGAAGAVSTLGGGVKKQIGAVISSLGGSAAAGVKVSAGELTRSLIGGRASGGGASGGGTGAGVNRHSQRQMFLAEKNADGTKKTFGEYLSGRVESGRDAGLDYLAKKEEQRKARIERLTNPGKYYYKPGLFERKKRRELRESPPDKD